MVVCERGFKVVMVAAYVGCGLNVIICGYGCVNVSQSGVGFGDVVSKVVMLIHACMKVVLMWF
jgi:hypothetical protein